LVYLFRDTSHLVQICTIKDKETVSGMARTLLNGAVFSLCLLVLASVARADDSIPDLTSLPQYLDRASRLSPALEVGRHRVQALQHQAQAAGRLPDLKLAWGEMIVPVETKVGPQQRAFSISQTIPWFGTLGLRRDGIMDQAAVEQSRLDAATVQLHQEIRSTWYQLALAQQELELYRQYFDLAAQSVHTVQAAYETGQTSFGDLVAAQREKARLAVGLQDREDRFKPLTARLNQLTGTPGGHPMPIADLTPPALPAWALADGPAVADSLESRNPQLEIRRSKLNAARTDLKLAGQRSRPGLTVGLDYIMTGEGDNPAAVDAGKDPVIARLAVSLPIWGGRPGVPETARDRSLLAEQASYSQQKMDLAASTEDISYRRRSAQRNLDLYDHTLLPQARQDLTTVSAAYQVGQADFGVLLKAQQTLLDLQLAQLQFQAQHVQALNDLAALLGHLPSTTTQAPNEDAKEIGP